MVGKNSQPLSLLNFGLRIREACAIAVAIGDMRSAEHGQAKVEKS
jgi:hypothetical protein